MRTTFRHFLRAIILCGFAAFFIQLHYTGDITKYINPKYDRMSQIAAGIFVFLFFIQLLRIWGTDQNVHETCSSGCHHHHESGSLLKRFINCFIIIFPLLTGFVLAPTTLDASIAANKGTLLPRAENKKDVNKSVNKEGDIDGDELVAESSEPPSEVETNQQEHMTPMPNNNFITEHEYDEAVNQLDSLDVIQMEKDLYTTYYDEINTNPKRFMGKKIITDGFVYREEGLAANQLVISRFVMVHCIADASILGFLTEFEQANEFQEDTWLEIEGTLDVTTYNGVEIPMIKADKWSVIEEPSEPYVYPVILDIPEN